MAHWRRGGGSLKEMRWLIGGKEVAHWSRGGGSLEEMRWLIRGDEVTLE